MKKCRPDDDVRLAGLHLLLLFHLDLYFLSLLIRF